MKDLFDIKKDLFDILMVLSWQLLSTGGGMYVEFFNRGVIPLAYNIIKNIKSKKLRLTWQEFTFFSLNKA